MPAREDFLGNLVFSSYYKDASPVRIASRVFSFVDSVSASLTSCKTRAAFPRGKNRLVELGARAGITVLAARAPTWNNSQWAGKYAVICSPPSNGLGWVQRGGTGQWPIKLTLGCVVLSARWWRTLIQTGGSGSIPRSALRTPHLKSEPPHVGCYKVQGEVSTITESQHREYEPNRSPPRPHPRTKTTDRGRDGVTELRPLFGFPSRFSSRDPCLESASHSAARCETMACQEAVWWDP